MSIRVLTCSHQRVAQYLFQLALWQKKKHFLWCRYCGKKQIDMCLSWSVLLSTTTTRHYSFPKHFSYCFWILSEFAKGFERKAWRVQVAHLHNACTFKSESVFSVVNKSWQRFLSLSFDIVVKKIECLLAWHWWNSTDLGLCINRHVFLHSECKNCCLYINIQKIAQQAESETYFQIWFFPRFGGKKWRRSEHARASYPGLFFLPARVQPLYGAGRKESSGTGLAGTPICKCVTHSLRCRHCS